MSMYRLVTHLESKENQKILQRAGQLANEEQRKVYYRQATKKQGSGLVFY